MADFDIPGTNGTAGVYPSEVNFPEPYKRPFASMSPAILMNDKGDVQLIIGASGGKKIPTAVSLVWNNIQVTWNSLQFLVIRKKACFDIFNLDFNLDQRLSIKQKDWLQIEVPG